MVRIPHLSLEAKISNLFFSLLRIRSLKIHRPGFIFLSHTGIVYNDFTAVTFSFQCWISETYLPEQKYGNLLIGIDNSSGAALKASRQLLTASFKGEIKP